MKATLVERALCTSEWLLVYLEESAQGIFWMDLSLTIVMVDIEMLLICTHNSYLFFFLKLYYRQLEGFGGKITYVP